MEAKKPNATGNCGGNRFTMGAVTSEMNEQDAIYAAATSDFGLVVRGDARALRKTRTALRDPGLVDLAILGPDSRGEIWLVRKDRLREHLIGGQEA